MRARGAFLAAALLAAAMPARAAVSVLTIGDLYDGGTVQLAAGDSLEIRPSSNPAAPCAWSVAFDDPAVVKPEEGSVATGAALFRFRAVAPGSGSIGLACRSAADPKGQPGGLFRVLAVVKDAIAPRSLILELPDNGSRIFLTQGDRIAVRLPSNPSTGYSWAIAANAPSVLQSGGDATYEPPAKPMPGAGGFQTFEFRVAGGGATSLELVYRKPSEKDAPPARRWAIFIGAAGMTP